MNRIIMRLLLVSLMLPAGAGAAPLCEHVFYEKAHRITIKDEKMALNGINIFVYNILNKKKTEMVIPRDAKLNLFPSTQGKAMENRQTLEMHVVEKYFEFAEQNRKAGRSGYFNFERGNLIGPLLSNLFFKPEPLQALQKGSVFQKHTDFAFVRSEMAAKSRTLYQYPQAAEAIIQDVRSSGRMPFAYKDKNRNIVVTNEHLFRVYREQNIEKIHLYRGQGGFDVYYLRLLLNKSKNEMQLRNEFAEWLIKYQKEVQKSRGVTGEQYNKLIVDLQDSKRSLEDIFSQNSPIFTTSLMYTSLSKESPNFFAARTQNPEVLTLTVDLNKLPDWYIDRVIYGSDLNIEVVFPFITAQDRQVLREAVSITARNALPKK